MGRIASGCRGCSSLQGTRILEKNSCSNMRLGLFFVLKRCLICVVNKMRLRGRGE